jgi:hypothetical protein
MALMGRDLAPLLIATIAYILAMLWMAGAPSGCLGDGQGQRIADAFLLASCANDDDAALVTPP